MCYLFNGSRAFFKWKKKDFIFHTRSWLNEEERNAVCLRKKAAKKYLQSLKIYAIF